MKPVQSVMPDVMPVLSRGKHRNPRSGGCFMEFASYLAGESWSDHPACTHPVLASLARMVNDCTSDDGRSRLTDLIPSVIGLRGTDPRVEIMVSLRAATAALPVVSLDRQRALAVGILSCERNLDRLGAGSPAISARIRAALDAVPNAEKWARDFIASVRSWSHAKFTPRTADSILRVSVQGIAEGCIPDPDALLRELLSGAIADTRAVLDPMPEPAVVQPQTAESVPRTP
ncbi:hypothetical protein [Cryobacterium roopkundense]|uniref:Uncharacterized protein n=1 Tax=Cryobacterium roopkundense TaxID=1001240 RepID=A0A7W8ZVI7_9MICO|nr:hypothetical protein [Cryobacterium roopkundense]MBB5640932.1 hypothetical protein [Cryobacterium roopkundense]